MRKILLATPLRGGLPARYVAALLQTLLAKIPGCTFEPVWAEGQPVNFARNTLANHALKGGFDELILWDADLKPNPEDFARLCAYVDEPFVSIPYPSRDGHALHHVQWTQGGESRGPLHEADLCSVGFCKINVSVLRAIQQACPDYACTFRESSKEAEQIHNFFPMQIFGPNTVEGKLERILAAMEEHPRERARPPYDEPHPVAIMDDIRSILDDPDYSASKLYGEDYGFCLLVRRAGVKLMVDTGIAIRHTGEVDYPLEPKPAEPPSPSLWPPDFIAQGVHPLHCADVLDGCYDVPVELEAPVILDLGANIGAFALWASRRWPGATIHCYEPEPGNFKMLEQSAGQILCPPCAIHLHQTAVMDKDGNAMLANIGNNCGGFSLTGDHMNKLAYPVPVRDAASLPEADILKIDTEGAEMTILHRLAACDRLRDFKAVMLEWHAAQFEPAIKELMAAHGFRLHAEKKISEHRGELRFIKENKL